MPHSMVTFRLHRRGLILLIVFAVIIAACLYAAGYLTAQWRQERARRPPPKTPAAAVKNGGRGAVPAAGAPARTAEPQTSLTLRVSVHTSEEEAKAQVASLTAAGLKPSIVTMPATTSGVTLYSVSVGHYTTRSAASRAAGELQSQLGLSPVIVPAKPAPNL